MSLPVQSKLVSGMPFRCLLSSLSGIVDLYTCLVEEGDDFIHGLASISGFGDVDGR